MRTGWRRVALSVVGLALLWVSGQSASGFSYFAYSGYTVIWPGAYSVRYMSASTFPVGSDTDTLYKGAMGLWVLVPSADFLYYYENLDFDPEIDHYDGYSDTAAVAAQELDPGVLGETYMVSYADQWYDMDMVFSDYPANVGWTMEPNPDCDMIRYPEAYGYSFLLVATHELGHALGLGHDPQGTESPGTPWFIGTMNPRYPAGGPTGNEAIVEVHSDDRNGTRFLYPHAGGTTWVTDLANPGYSSGDVIGRAVPCSFSPAAVHPGEVLTLRSVIENYGNTNTFNVRQGFYLSTDADVNTSDLLLGTAFWDLPYGAGFDFDAELDMPADIAAGVYYVGTIFDDLDEVAEEYEDNNTHVYCNALAIQRLAPVVNELGQDLAACGVTYIGPTPTVTHPLNMAPLTWSIDNPESGMSINSSTGVVYWPNPVRAEYLYTIIVRATNSAGSSTQVLYLGVEQDTPHMQPIADQSTPHTLPYTGPTPVLTNGPCMLPVLNWSLDSAPAGMTIDHMTGVVWWNRPRYAATPYQVSIRATNAIGNGVVNWRLHVTGLVGDLNCDGLVNNFDISAFVKALTDPAGYELAFPTCDRNLGDVNGDGIFNNFDIAQFVQMLTK
ncbi:MAG: matrixin family metalloprotease [Phycisphaerae bacterium]|jgi:hypothetical protein